MSRFVQDNRIGLFVAALFLLLLGSTVVMVGEDQQAVIERMGQPDRVINRFRSGDSTGAGIAIKVPLVEQIVWLPRNLITFSHTAKRLRSTDQQWLMIDTDVTYRIIDPVKLVGTLGTGDQIDAQLKALLPSLLDQELSQRSAGQIAGPGASGANIAMRRGLDAKTRQYGVQVIDVRVARVNLDEASLQATYERMRERQETALFDIEAKGVEDARAIAGAAEAEAATRIQQSAAKDREFYSFFKAMRSYEALYGDPERKNAATIVLPAGSGYLKHFGGN